MRLALVQAGVLMVVVGWWAAPRAMGAGPAPIVVFEQHSVTGEYAGDVDIGAQRISATGELMWNEGDRSATVSSAKHIERAPFAIPDGVGGIIVVFEAEARTGEHAGDTEIFAQRVDANGNMMWNNGESSIVVASSTWSEKNPVAVPDGRGGAIVIFEQHAKTGEYAGDVDIGAQRISATGELMWNDGDRSVTVASGERIERAPAAIPDGAGGAIVVFEAEARTGEYAGDTEIYAQRIDANGNMVWEDGESSTMVASSKWREKNPIIVVP